MIDKTKPLFLDLTGRESSEDRREDGVDNVVCDLEPGGESVPRYNDLDENKRKKECKKEEEKKDSQN